MSQAIDIKGLQEIIGGNPVQYHEIIRNEKAINCVARWPLLAQIQNGGAAMPVVTAPPVEIGESPRHRADVPVRPVMAASAHAPAPFPAAGNSDRVMVDATLSALWTQARVAPNRTMPAPAPASVPMQKATTPVPAPARWLATAATALPFRASTSAPAVKVPSAQSSGLTALFKRLEFANETDNGSAR